MITNEQKKEISKYLLGKNLPLDLLIEVQDHMIEQIENMDNVDFNEAFEKVKFLWRNELKLVYSLRIGYAHTITNFQNKVGGKLHWNMLLKSTVIFSVYFLFVFLIGRNHFQMLLNLVSISYFISISITVLAFVAYFDILKKTLFITRAKINIYQKGAGNFITGALFILIFNNVMFNKNKFVYGTYELFQFKITLKNISETVLNFGYLFMWVYGLLYLIKFRKSILELQKRTSLKI